MLKYTQITNVGHVDVLGGRLWAEFVLIDAPRNPEGHGILDNIRTIRGCATGGLPVFTFWIAPQAEVKLETEEGGRVIMLRDGREPAKLDSGLRIVVGDFVIALSKKDLDEKMDVREIEVESCPFGEEVDREILKYYRAPNYPIVQYLRADAVRRILAGKAL